MSQFHEVAHRQGGAVLIVNLQTEQPLRAQAAAGHDNGDLFGVAAQLRVPEAAGENDDSIDAASMNSRMQRSSSSSAQLPLMNRGA